MEPDTSLDSLLGPLLYLQWHEAVHTRRVEDTSLWFWKTEHIMLRLLGLKTDVSTKSSVLLLCFSHSEDTKPVISVNVSVQDEQYIVWMVGWIDRWRTE